MSSAWSKEAGTPGASPGPGRPSVQPAAFGPYETIDLLGQGGMGIVYRARHRVTGEVVALKTVSAARHQRLLGIRAEIVALSNLTHPQIVRIRDHGIQDNVPWYAMELLTGETMADHLDRIWPGRTANVRTMSTSPRIDLTRETAPLSPGAGTHPPRLQTEHPPAGARVAAIPEILAMFRAICEPLGYLHGRGIVHRDLKPSNVFIREDGVPVLMDFGLISRAEGSLGREVLELGGQLAGTLPYLSPEQLRRESLDARADLYALGCMLYEAITGSTPVTRPGGDAHGLRERGDQRNPTDPVVRPSDLVDAVDPRLDDLIMSLLAPERRARVGRADDVAHLLAEIERSLRGGTGATQEISEVPAYLYRPEIVGRERALEELSSLVTRLAANRGRYAFLSGESGIGKTFLASEVTRRAGLLGLRLVVGECAPPDQQTGAPGLGERRGVPLQPLRPLLTLIADQCLEGGRERTDRILGEHGKILAAHLPGLAALPGQAGFPDPPALSAEENHRRLLNSLLHIIAAYIEEGPPLLMVIDDLQWADELSLAVLAAIEPAWLEDKGLMILGTFRSDEVGKELRALIGRAGVTSVAIGRMGTDAVGQIVADMLAVPTVPASMVEFLAAQAEGVPFFVAEYLRMALGQGLLQRSAGRWQFKEGQLSEAELRRLPLPKSIHDLMSLRLAGLDPELRAIVNLAAIMGREADVEFLAAASEAGGRPLPLERTIEQVRELVRLQFLEAPTNGRYRFVHDKLREAAYAGIPVTERIALHRSVAGMLAALPRDPGEPPPYAELAHHFTQGQLWERAVDYLEKAGDQALASFSHHEAIGFFTAALAHAPKVSTPTSAVRIARWERHLVDSHLALGDMPTAHQHASAALAHCGFRFPSHGAGWFFGFLGQVALRLVRPVLPKDALLIPPGERRELVNEAAYVLNRLCEPFFLAHRPLEGFYCGFRDLNLAERVPASEALARGYATMAMVVGVGPFGKLGRAWSDRAISIARGLGSEGAVTYCLARSGVVLLTGGDWQEGRARIGEADAIARRVGDLRQLGETLTTMALLDGYKGDFARSLASAEEVIQIGDARGDRQLRHWGRNLAVHALARMGRTREAIAIIRQMMEYHANAQLGEAEKIFDLGGFALIQLSSADLVAAQTSASQALDALRKARFLPYFLKTALDGTCEVLLALLEESVQASRAERSRLRNQAREIVRRLRKFAGLYIAARPRALIYEGMLHHQSGAPKAAFGAWEKALVLARRLQMQVDEGRAHFELGRHLPAGQALVGLTGPAHVSRGLGLLRSAGAAWDLTRASAILPLKSLPSPGPDVSGGTT
jgi:serine/threonine protein kinase/tetratricopeptide (TPR) repeat protein